MNDVAAAVGTPPLAAIAGGKTVSAVSWAAIAAGAVVAAAASVLLITLGAGVGLSIVSPWSGTGATATTFATTTAIGLIIVQWISAGIGGYMAGRLRTRWVSLHTHEVFFRDTAHGFITWATATLLFAAASATMTGATLGGGAHAAAVVASAASGTASVDPYDVDTLLRSANTTGAPGNDVRPQVTRILARSLTSNDLSVDDRAYLVQLVAAQTGVSASDAEVRVDAAIARLQQAKLQAQVAADTARKAARSAAIFTALAMLIGAFIACLSAALGGRLRDLHP